MTLKASSGSAESPDGGRQPAHGWSLRRRLPILIFSLLAVLGTAFAWMAYYEVKRVLLSAGTERIAAAGGQVVDLLEQSAVARLAEAKRLADAPDVRRAIAQRGDGSEASLPETLRAFVARNPQTSVWLYDKQGQVISELLRGEQAPPIPASATLVQPFAGVSPLRSEGERVVYQTAAPVFAPAVKTSPVAHLAIQRPLGSSPAVALIERLIGSGAALKLGNASADGGWTGIGEALPAPPSSRPGTAATYRRDDGESRIGMALPVSHTPWVLWVEMSERAVLGPAATLLKRMLPITIALTVLGALAVSVLGGRVARPLAEMATAAEAIAAGDYSRRVTPGRGQEVGRLGAAFNVMAQKVADAHTELETRVRDRTAELESARAELATANRELEAFSYSVSHDLRAPLRSIDGFAQALAEDYEDRLDATGRDYLGRIRRAAQRMGTLIDDLLSLSRVTRVELTRTVVDLSAAVEDVARQLQEEEPHRTVEWRIQPGVTAEGDSRLLQVAIDNLISNAWKFTSRREAPVIEFGIAALDDGRRAYMVRDNGAGFDMAHAGKLFGAFQRLHRNAEFPGSGIGLATVHRIVRRHGGRVWAEGAVEAGATFYFTLEES